MEINYKKKFIILKNKYANIKGYRPKGHMKLEIKGVHTNINVNIENAEASSAYTLTLITEEIIELGKIYTDAYGRSKSELILSTEDFLQGELEQGAVVIHRDEQVLLGEYMNKEDGRIEEFIESLSHREPEPVIEIEEEPEIEETLFMEEEVPDEIDDAAFHVKKEFYEETIEEAIEEVIEEVIEETGYEEAPETFEIEEDQPEEYALQEGFIENLNPGEEAELEEPETEEVGQENYVDLEYEYSMKKVDQTTDYVLSILRYFPYAEPFNEELQDHNWWKIDYNGEVEEGFLPYFDYAAGANATALMRKYGHYLFGLYNQGDEIKYYIFGVPGEFTLEEHPNAGEPGFETWFEGTEEVGYWLLYIDPLTGKVVEPLDPMNLS